MCLSLSLRSNFGSIKETFLTIYGVWKTKSMRLRLSMYICVTHAAESKYRIRVLNF